jgi:Protein of unknown function (DUF5672)
MKDENCISQKNDYSTSIVAVVIPYYKNQLTADEIISFKHLEKFLGAYDKYLLCPKSLQVKKDGFKKVKFDDAYFLSVDTYSKLLLTKHFYQNFRDYKYILIYQLDCLVFSDDLSNWTEYDYDYVGAPLFKSKSDCYRGFSRVGNGGLSLRNVNSFLNVLNSKRYLTEKVFYFKDILFTPLEDLYNISIIRRLIKRLKVFKNVNKGVRWYSDHYTLNEDHFWMDRAKLFYPIFNIAPIDVALRFAFELHPRYCFKKNGYKLPFGCHAWAKWDRKFWERYLKY